jgi:hypothetical protein
MSALLDEVVDELERVSIRLDETVVDIKVSIEALLGEVLDDVGFALFVGFDLTLLDDVIFALFVDVVFPVLVDRLELGDDEALGVELLTLDGDGSDLHRP